MFEVSVSARFSAAHHLEGYPGSCASVHGHNWEVEVFVRGETLNETGILVDFRRLRAAVSEILEEVDHSDLNALQGLAGTNPTSENVARFLYARLAEAIDTADCAVHRVTVEETPGSRATYWEDSAGDSAAERP